MIPNASSLFSLISFGRDMTKISFPVDMFEPLGTLQCLCEELEYSELLDKAAADENPFMRMVYVTAFGVSRYASTVGRHQKKPFVPLEGETYENKRDDLGWWFVGEQVSVWPMVSAYIAKGRGWEMKQTAYYGLKFWGTSIDIDQKSPVEIFLTKYYEHHGQMTVTCTNGHQAKIIFDKSSGTKKHEIHGDTYDSEHKLVHTLSGHWSKELHIVTNSMEKFTVWTANKLPDNSAQYYGFTRFGLTLNEVNTEMKQRLPPTDSRFRPDMRMLEEGKMVEGEKMRQKLEADQNERRKNRQSFKPNWFTKEDKYVYFFNDSYWQSRDGKFTNETFEPLW